MNWLIAALLGVFLALVASLANMDAEVKPQPTDKIRHEQPQEDSGFGISTTGRIGLEVAPGVVYTTKGLELGFGF